MRTPHDPARRRDNLKKYMRPPTWKEIEKVIKKTGMNKYHFELYYGINYNHLAQVKDGTRKLSLTYWHIFYEFRKTRKKPAKDIPTQIPSTQPAGTEDYVHPRFSILK